MGMTITEKILARAAGLDRVQPGQFLDCKVDQVASMDLQGKLVFNTLGKLGTEQMFDPARVAFTLDHQSPAQTVAIADVHAAIRGAAELMEEDMPEDRRRRFLKNIRGESARIQRIVERLLELTSIEARRALNRIEPIETTGLVEEAAEAVRSAYAAAGVTLTVVDDVRVRFVGERFLLWQALVNLLQNALDFSPLGGEVTLLGELGVVERLLGTVEISAAVLPVRVQEQRIKPAVEIVVMRDVMARAPARIELMEAAVEIAEQRLWPRPVRNL